MPSIKKRVTGFIRQISGPAQDARPLPVSPPPQYEKCFIQRYLGGESRPPQPDIQFAKTGHSLPVIPLAQLQPEVFAAYTGPAGGLTSIKRRKEESETGKPPPPPNELDYIDLEDSRNVSRRVSMAVDMVESFENGALPPVLAADKPAGRVKVPKSPVFIDNTVMTIRVMNRVYRVDDRTKTAEGPTPREHCVSAASFSSSSSVSDEEPPSPLYQTSQIVDIDSQLDLVETEDGYLPASCLPAEERKPDRKVVSIASPVRPLPRPSYLNLSYPAYSSSLLSRTVSSSVIDSRTESPGGSYQSKRSRKPTPALLENKTKDAARAIRADADSGGQHVAGGGGDHLSLAQSLSSLSVQGLAAAGCEGGDAKKNGRLENQPAPVHSRKNRSEAAAGGGGGDVSSQSSGTVPPGEAGGGGATSKQQPSASGQSRTAGGRLEESTAKENIKSSHSSSQSSKQESEYPELQEGKASASSGIKESDILENLTIDLKDDISTVYAGIRHWGRPNSAAYGLCESLYESNPVSGEQAGSPIADTFAIVARKNSAILVLGDGVNWGAKAALASRSAVYGATEYLNQALFAISRTRSLTTQDVFQILLRSFHSAHCLILEQEAMLTTLTAAVVLPTKDNKFHLCVCNVGDSLAYVYSKGQVREVTQGSHDITANRDMRDALGALGPVDGMNPELSNLTCSMTEVLPGDIVFLTSDGISDNFDPVVGKFCVPRKPERNHQGGSSSSRQAANHSRSGRSRSVAEPEGGLLPTVEAFQRHELTLLRIEDTLNHDWGSATANSGCGPVSTAAELCQRMLDFCQRLTTAKRKILEDPELYPAAGEEQDMQDQKIRRRRVCEKLAMVPGKLDHASIVAYQVGDRTAELAEYRGDRTDPLPGRSTPGLAQLAAPCASCEDLTMRESPDDGDGEEDEDDLATPTGSQSLSSTPLGSGASSLAATPTHHRGGAGQLS